MTLEEKIERIVKGMIEATYKRHIEHPSIISRTIHISQLHYKEIMKAIREGQKSVGWNEYFEDAIRAIIDEEESDAVCLTSPFVYVREYRKDKSYRLLDPESRYLFPPTDF